MNFRPRFTASLALMNVAGRDPADVLGPLPPDNGKNSLNVSVGVSLPVWKESYRARRRGSRGTGSRRIEGASKRPRTPWRTRWNWP